MKEWLRRRIELIYTRLLTQDFSGVPTHVAVIQDGNRRYARKTVKDTSNPHRFGAQTTEQVMEWCQDVGVKELTLYTFSTENFDRPHEENEALFDLICEKLQEFADADRVHEHEVSIRAIGDIERLPERVQDAIQYAEGRTREYDQFVVNIALAYGGRSKLLESMRSIARDVNDGELEPTDIDTETIEQRLYDRPLRDVDLIIRTGGAERTSNFLPWYASGNEAAVFFCTPYWPEFSKADFLRGIRTYESRETTWRRTRAKRALALLRALSDAELNQAKNVIEKFHNSLPMGERPERSEMKTDNSKSGQ